MAAARPRHVVTETDALAEALDHAAIRWPGMSRTQLLVELAMEGHRAALRTVEERRGQRLAAVLRHSGSLTSTYGADYLQRLREEWSG